MILFLDFDGVLHPEPPGRNEFCNLARLEAVLREYQHVDVVISSTWRIDRDWGSIMQIFSHDIRPRVIGKTPQQKDFAGPEELGRYAREAECREWLRLSQSVSRGWLALDDRHWEFRPFCPNLILCERAVGFNDVIEERLKMRLNQGLRR